jgi:hypothetical protein
VPAVSPAFLSSIAFSWSQSVMPFIGSAIVLRQFSYSGSRMGQPFRRHIE